MEIGTEMNVILRNAGKEKSFRLLVLKFITIFIFHESYCLFTPFFGPSVVFKLAPVTEGSS
jgi:hypothetical protein